MAHSKYPKPALWPIAHNQILRYGPWHKIESRDMAHTIAHNKLLRYEP
jgi:hypothetical protein